MTVRNTSEGAEENYKKICSWIEFKRNHSNVVVFKLVIINKQEMAWFIGDDVVFSYGL